MTNVSLKGISRRYGSNIAVDNLSLDMASGELVALLGSSGCGKTTTLRMVAGFVPLSGGRIEIGGNDVTDEAPNHRDIGLVFQSYALFPHLTVADNIAFGLRRRTTPKVEIAKRVAEMIDLMRLGGLADRLPAQLSGGQQQRVAVGRALVINPSVLLLDEPFSNLDAKLRHGTSLEMRRLQSSLGITTLFVTHDQQEAMAMADRVAVMQSGRIEQIGSGPQIYHRPATRFVAEFIGAANFFAATIVTAGDKQATVDCLGARLSVSCSRSAGHVGNRLHLMIRPEFVQPAQPGRSPHFTARIEAMTFLGPSIKLSMRLLTGEALLAEIQGAAVDSLKEGQDIGICIDPDQARLYDQDGHLI